MKKIYLAILIAVLVISAIPQFVNAQQTDWCLSEILFQQNAAKDPSLLLKREQDEIMTQKYISDHANQKTASVVRIIPVVFHVIHEGGAENISMAQILDQMDILNKDYRRLNADTVNTPAVFQSLGADCQIEFRLAQLDPNGNCTDGITRRFSHLTNDARDNIKAFDYWPSNKYLNMWVVKSILNTSGVNGIIIGYAQFPGGTATTDGVVLKYDWTGSIGAAAANGGMGRTATHEVGHWLNLRHIWGDATCGNDLVFDTPVQNVNFSTCPTWPKIDAACGNAPNGALFPDYMDYTNGSCQNIFSIGQSQRMDAALVNPLWTRKDLHTAANLIATGTDGTPPVTCTPVADFVTETKLICAGTTLSFEDGSWNGDPTTWTWTFQGGSPPNATTQNVAVLYSTPGTYDVTLTVTNSAGTNTKTAVGMVVVSPASGVIGTLPFQEGFESITVPGNDWFVYNDVGNTWEQTSVAAHTGFTSMRINNYSGNPTNSRDNLITTSFDLTNVSGTSLTFWRAFAYRSNSSEDYLKVYASTTCGQIWTLRYTKTGIALGTAGLLSSNFVPSALQWDKDTVNLASTAVSGHPGVRFKFEYFQDTGNNIYLDDINLNGVVGMNELLAEQLNFEVYPNPAHTKANVSFALIEKSFIRLQIYDVTGRQVSTLDEQNLDAGEYQYDVDGNLDNGIYYIRLSIGDHSTVKKLVLY
ncbi:MAG: PKD domain-containing protein [Bacteroidia bacterium]